MVIQGIDDLLLLEFFVLIVVSGRRYFNWILHVFMKIRLNSFGGKEVVTSIPIQKDYKPQLEIMKITFEVYPPFHGI